MSLWNKFLSPYERQMANSFFRDHYNPLRATSLIERPFSRFPAVFPLHDAGQWVDPWYELESDMQRPFQILDSWGNKGLKPLALSKKGHLKKTELVEKENGEQSIRMEMPEEIGPEDVTLGVGDRGIYLTAMKENEDVHEDDESHIQSRHMSKIRMEHFWPFEGVTENNVHAKWVGDHVLEIAVDVPKSVGRKRKIHPVKIGTSSKSQEAEEADKDKNENKAAQDEDTYEAKDSKTTSDTKPEFVEVDTKNEGQKATSHKQSQSKKSYAEMH